MLRWQQTGKPGIVLRTVREDRVAGRFLGLVGFEPFSRSGLHQHRGVATSFFVDGGLTDHVGGAGLHEVGINLAGSTHDAIAYRRTLLVSRLEGPVVYPPDTGALSALHAGASHAPIEAAPSVPPEINVPIDAIAPVRLGMAGAVRRTAFDYAGTGSAHRMTQLTLAPGALLPAFETSALVELWIRGGAIEINGRSAHANCFVLIEPATLVHIGSRFGAMLLAWAEGPARWADAAPADANEPFGF